jgi:hypothetical protein
MTNATRETTQINSRRTLIVLPGLAGAIDERSLVPRYAKAAAITRSNAANKIESMPV